MLDRAELDGLSRWCRARHLHWLPARADDGSPAVLLEPSMAGAAWATMLLVADDQGFHLLDGPGETLAAASDLPALLDALDGGVAEAPRRGRRAQRPWPRA